MDTVTQIANQKRIGRRVLLGVVIAALLVLLLAVYAVNYSPRTDDASVWANYIQVVPQVTGWLVELPIKDNAFVKQGDLLFLIDPRPYENALQQALSDQKDLEEQIIDEHRRIAAQNTATAAEAQLKRETNNLHRNEPLLQKQYVTVEQVDTANTDVHVSQGR